METRVKFCVTLSLLQLVGLVVMMVAALALHDSNVGHDYHQNVYESKTLPVICLESGREVTDSTPKSRLNTVYKTAADISRHEYEWMLSLPPKEDVFRDTQILGLLDLTDLKKDIREHLLHHHGRPQLQKQGEEERRGQVRESTEELLKAETQSLQHESNEFGILGEKEEEQKEDNLEETSYHHQQEGDAKEEEKRSTRHKEENDECKTKSSNGPQSEQEEHRSAHNDFVKLGEDQLRAKKSKVAKEEKVKEKERKSKEETNGGEEVNIEKGDGMKDAGFNLFFQSNTEEVQNAPIQFDKPLPSWLAGTLVRNGLGLFENGDRTFVHAFDGFAKLSSWRFESNSSSAFFSTKFLASDFYKESMRDNTIAPYLLFERPDPQFSLWERLIALIRGLDNMNVNVYRFPADAQERENGGDYDYVALSDYWKAYTISPYDLSTGQSVVGRLSAPTRPLENREGTTAKGRSGAGKGDEVNVRDNSRFGGGREERETEDEDEGGRRDSWFGGGLGINLESATFLDLLSSAHPLPEPGTSNHLTFLSSVSVLPFTSNRIQLIRVRSTTHREVVASWRVDRLPYMHSFSVTRTHALVLAHPFYVNVMCMAVEVTPFRCLDWHPEENSTLYVIRLSDGHITELSMENVFTMHHVNAFNLNDADDDDQTRYRDGAADMKIVLDISAYPNPDFVGHLQLSVLRSPKARDAFPAQAHLRRYLVDLGAGQVKRVHLPAPSPAFVNFLDMPTINEGLRAKSYCFVYGLGLKTDNVSLTTVDIVKRDMCGQGRDRYWILSQHYPVEPLFVPNPQGVAEDDGVVLVPMIDGPAGRSYMAVLNATDLSVISTAYLPTVVPYSLHGRFFTEIQ